MIVLERIWYSCLAVNFLMRVVNDRRWISFIGFDSSDWRSFRRGRTYSFVCIFLIVQRSSKRVFSLSLRLLVMETIKISKCFCWDWWGTLVKIEIFLRNAGRWSSGSFASHSILSGHIDYLQRCWRRKRYFKYTRFVSEVVGPWICALYDPALESHLDVFERDAITEN